MIIDAHSDLLVELVYAERELGERNPFRTRWLPPLRQGGVALQVCALYVAPDMPAGEALPELLHQVRAFHTAVEANSDTVFAVKTAADLQLVGTGRIGLMLSLEGASSFGSEPWLIDVLARLGVRMASLTWNERNAFAGGCAYNDGLTPLGEDLIDRLAGLGIVVDLAHASPRTVGDVVARLGAPPVVSHAACRALHDHPRNLSDSQMRAIAELDGVIGLMPHPLTVGPSQPTITRFLEHVDHAVEVVGIDHVGLGGDFLRQIARALGDTLEVDNGLRPDAALDGLEGPQDYPALADALADRGVRENDRDKLLGGNILRVLRAVQPAEPEGAQL